MADNTDTTGETGAPGAGESQGQGQGGEGKTFSQDELNAIVADRVKRAEANALKQFEGVDLTEYRNLKQAASDAETERLKAKGDLDAILKRKSEEHGSALKAKDDEIARAAGELKTVRIDDAIRGEAESAGAINSADVVALMRSSVDLDEHNVPVVRDSNGMAAYENGSPVTIQSAVSAFLKSRPHLVKAAPAGAGSVARAGGTTAGSVDLASLDMSNPEHREMFRKAGGMDRDQKLF